MPTSPESPPTADTIARARARLQAAGLPEPRIALLLDRAARLLTSLEEIASLDPHLPEPALIWQPIEEGS